MSQVCPLNDRQLVEKCLEFVQTFANRRFYRFQRRIAFRIIESLIQRDGATITGLVSRQAGKTETVSKTVVGLLIILPLLSAMFPDDARLTKYREGLKVLIFGPIEDKAFLPYDRARDQVNSEHGQKILASLKLSTGTNKKGQLTLSNGSSLIARSASANTNNEGYSGHLIVLEETQDISRQKIEKEVRPILANTHGTMVAIGTANEVGATFKEMIENNLAIFADTGQENHFEFNWKEVVEHKKELYAEEKAKHAKGEGPAPNEGHLEYNKHVLGEIRRLGGEHTPEFRMNFLLKWREYGAGAINRAAWKAGAVERLEFGQRFYRGKQVAGLDVGKTNDATCIVVADLDWEHPIRDDFAINDDKEEIILHNKCVTDVVFFKGDFEGRYGQYESILRFLMTKGIGLLCVDCTALGDPVFERIRALVGDVMQVVPERFTTTNKLNLYKHYTQEIEAGRVKYAAGRLTQQMPSYKRFDQEHFELLKVVDEDRQKVSYQAPQGMHDDAPDAGALMCRAATLVKGMILPYIEMQEMPRGARGPQQTAPTARHRRVVSSDSPLYRTRRLQWLTPRAT